MKKISFFLLVICFCSCSNNKESAISESEKKNEESLIENPSSEDTVQSENDLILPDSSGQILTMGCHHGDELNVDPTKYSWNALIFSEGKYLIKTVKIKITNCFDPIIDEDESKKTGKEIIVENEKDIHYLIGGNFGIKEGQLNTIKNFKEVMEIGKTYRYQFNNTDLVLKCSGKRTQEEHFSIYKNFKLEYTYGDLTQIIYSESEYSSEADTLFSIPFFGDIDSDGIPDLILDTEPHYNVSGITLFLSGSAEKGKILRKVASYRTTGC